MGRSEKTAGSSTRDYSFNDIETTCFNHHGSWSKLSENLMYLFVLFWNFCKFSIKAFIHSCASDDFTQILLVYCYYLWDLRGFFLRALSTFSLNIIGHSHHHPTTYPLRAFGRKFVAHVKP
jgi:hypothetical protein